VLPKIKQRLRTISSRTQEALWTAMQSVLDTVTASDAIDCASVTADTRSA